MKQLPRLGIAVALMALLCSIARAQMPAAAPTQKIFIDTDIGDDIDDAFALALALNSPELQITGISSAWGDTALRARMIERLLQQSGHAQIPIGAGVATAGAVIFSQKQWAQGGPEQQFPDGVELLRQAILANPHQLTLIAIAPLTNIGALLHRDPATFRLLKRVVIMGGSVYRGYGDPGTPPAAEYNIKMDPAAAKALFASGVPVTVMPLDSTLVPLTPQMQASLTRTGPPFNPILTELLREWSLFTKWPTPTLFDVVPVASLLDRAMCPLTPMHLTVDAKGYTRPTHGTPNAQVCLHLDEARFSSLLAARLEMAPQ